MDPEIVTVAGVAGTTLVSALTTDAWQHARDGVVALWRRFRPEGADAVTRDLDEARTTLLAAAGTPQDEVTAQALRLAWQGQVMAVLLSDPEAVDAVRTLLARISPPQGQEASVRMHATAKDHGRIYQAGRDQHITER